MSKYIDISTGKEYDEIPQGKVQPYIVKGQAVTEGAYNRYYNEHPTELDEVVITPETQQESQTTSYDPTMTEQNMFHRAKVAAADARVRRTAFTDENTLPFWLHALSPSQQIGAIIDGFQGGSYGDYVRSLTYGNSGIFTDAYAARNPGIVTAGNIGFDMITPAGLAKLYTWGTTPRIIGQGVSKQAWTTPLSRRVTYIGGDSEYIQAQNGISQALKLRPEGVTLTGELVHSAPKVIMTKSPGKNLFQRVVDNDHYFPTMFKGDTEVALVNPGTRMALTDLEYGFNPFNWRRYLVDPEVMPIHQYAQIVGYKKGGKLIPKYKYCNI